MIIFKNLYLTFFGQEVFADVSFIINKKDKIGLIGRNGSGKTTLLKMLNNEVQPDNGEILKPKNYKIGYLKQHIHFTKDNVMEEAYLALPEHEKDSLWLADKILTGLGFSEDDFLSNPNDLSGGWQIRLNLAKILISDPDLLLLDEPTNYLDITTIRWLKRFLKSWSKELMLITHDKGFMNDVITQAVLIHRKTMFKNKGNVDDMHVRIAEEEEVHENTRLNQEKQRKKQQDWIDRFRYKATLASNVQSRIKLLEKQETKVKLDKIQNLDFKFNYKDTLAKKLFEAHELEFGYSADKTLIKNLSFTVNPGDRICVIGKNGTGKSTLLKLLNNFLTPVKGDINLNPKTEIGYFGQMNISRLIESNTILEEMQSMGPEYSFGQIRSVCGLMMFSGDAAKKKISILSGGEKSRVVLGKILLQSCNLLILDEPTNHLDMESCEALTESLHTFKGASIVVTHSEEILKAVATKLIVFDNKKSFVFEGTYQQFLKEVGWSGERK